MRRLLLHIPVGLALAWLTLAHWSLTLVFGFLFVSYELNQDSYKKDHAHKDMIGALWGIPIGVLVIAIAKRWRLRPQT